MQTLQNPKRIHAFSLGCAAALVLLTQQAQATRSAELYTTAAYQYGRFEARLQFAFGDGVISSFFLWKDGSEMSDVFWNELDFEKLRANCELETNALYGLPVAGHNAVYDPAVEQSATDLCGEFHTYAYEWTPDYIAWFIDSVEVRRDTGESAAAFRDNATQGMQLHFNIWPGNAEFGGNFNPAILPLHQFVNWVQYSSFSGDAFHLEWREDFDSNAVPSGWATGTWESPKNLSTHTTANVTFKNGYAVLSLTADDATGSAGVNPMDPGDSSVPNPQPDAGATSQSDAGSTPTTPISTTGVTASTAPSAGAVPSAGTVASAAATETPAGSSASVQPPAPTLGGATQSVAVPGSTVALPSSAAASSTAPANSGPDAIASTSPTTSATAIQNEPKSAGGCDCQLARTPKAMSWAWLVALLGLTLSRIRGRGLLRLS